MKRFFDSELETLRSELFRMGECVILQLQNVLRSYEERDSELADTVIAADNEIDDLEKSIDEEAIRYMGLRSPVATQLRVLVTAMKASHEFERAGDEITKIARRIRSLSADAPIRVSVDISHMGELAAGMLRDALDCFFQSTEEKALGICQRDAEVDQMNRDLQDELTRIMTNHPELVGRSLDLIFVAKAIERVADHATNIAEETIYLIKAKDVRHTPEVRHAPEPA